MSCNIKIVNGKEVGFTDAGTESQLFKDAVNKLGEKEGKNVFLVSLSDDFKDTIPPAVKYDPKRIADKYSRLINKIKKEQPSDYWSVDVPSQEEIKSAAEAGRIVDIKGGMGIVTEDGNMVGLFKYDTTQTGTAAAVQEARVKMGGIKLDNFDNYLTKTYERNGFRVVARTPFNEEYAPEDWSKEKHGTPDVVFMVYDPNSKLDIKEKTFTDYDEGKAYRDTYVDKAKSEHPFYAVNPSTSANYANLTEDGKGNFVFYHVGNRGYETIRRSSGSTLATAKTEGAALSKVGGVAMYYTRPTDVESMVSGDTTYMVKVPQSKVYDFNTDSLNLKVEARALHAKEHPGKAFDTNTQVAYITKLAGEKGFDMVVSEWNGRTRAQTTKEFAPVDTQELNGNIISKPFKNNYVNNREKGYIASIPKSKADSLDEVYTEIHNERNRQNKYDSLYHLAHSPKPAQEEITKMIMDSDISEELKQKYQDILGSPEQRRESFKVEEPSLETVMKYITAQNEVKEPMTDEQTQDYKNALLSVKDFTLDKLKKTFYDENGVFFVNSSKLVSSGLYSQYEAEHLMKDIELQEQVRASIEALKNTEDIAPIEQEFDLTEKENEFSSFGKLNNLNPYIVQKQIQTELAATTREEFDEAVGTLPFSNFQKSIESEDAKDKLFNDMQAFKKAEMMIEVDGTIKSSLNSNTEVIVPQVVQDLTGTKVLNDIKYFLRQDTALLKNVLKNEAKVMVNTIEKGLIEQGYDVIGLSAKAPDVYMMQYLVAVADLTEATSKDALNEYVNVYNKYFEKDLSAEKGFLKTEQDDRNFVKLNTELKEEETYNQQGLIKQGEGLYIKVNKKSAEELYPIVATYPEKLPSNVKNEEQLRKYVQSQVNNDEVSDPDTAEAISLFKLYYGIPLKEEAKKVDTTEFNQKQAQFTGNQEYLQTDFVGDFYRDGLKEKAKESKAYKDFYRHFKVTEKGLELENNDPITLETIKPYVTENLKNYSLLSKSMPNLKSEEVEFVDSKNSRRSEVVNYPSNVAKFEGNISIIDNSTLVTKNVNDEFIKLKNDVYENVETIGNLTLYTKLATPSSNFLNFDVEAPVTNYNLEDYLHLDSKPEAFIKAKNYLSKEEKDNLESDEFSCV